MWKQSCSQYKWPIAQAPWILRQGLTWLLLARRDSVGDAGNEQMHYEIFTPLLYYTISQKYWGYAGDPKTKYEKCNSILQWLSDADCLSPLSRGIENFAWSIPSRRMTRHPDWWSQLNSWIAQHALRSIY